MGPTLAEIEAARTPAGGWTKATLAQWGVPWPPPKGWKEALVSRAVGPPAAADPSGHLFDRDPRQIC